MQARLGTAYIQVYLIKTNDITAQASRQCFPTFGGAPHTEASSGRLSAPLSAAHSPSLSLHHTSALTKIVIYDPWSREHGAGLLGAAGVVGKLNCIHFAHG